MSSSSSAREVVVDAGPVIALARLDLLAIPDSVFGKALITQVVLQECLANQAHDENHAIRLALETQLLEPVHWLQPAPASMWSLDPGEASAINLAARRKAFVLVDDLAARRVARDVGLKVVGTCGLLLEARRLNLVAEVRPLVEKLSESGYYLSRSLIETVCRLAGES